MSKKALTFMLSPTRHGGRTKQLKGDKIADSSSPNVAVLILPITILPTIPLTSPRLLAILLTRICRLITNLPSVPSLLRCAILALRHAAHATSFRQRLSISDVLCCSRRSLSGLLTAFFGLRRIGRGLGLA
jgi:hypothetical protein